MSKRILFVDDEPFILQALQRQLRGKFETAVAQSGAEGLKVLAESGPFAIVVADMRMPQMDGIEFLRKVRSQHPRIVCMMLTGNADRQTALDAVNEGKVFHFLTKPCDSATLIAALNAGLELYSLEQQITQIDTYLGKSA